mgnify:FL=1
MKCFYLKKNMKSAIILFVMMTIFSTLKLEAGRWFLEDEWSLEQYYKFKRNYEELRTSKSKYQLLADTTARKFDVIIYDITLDWYELLLSDSTEKEKRFWNGKNDIKLVVKEDNLDKITLDAIGLEFLTISVDGDLLQTTPQIVDDVVDIPLVTGVKAGDTVRIEIEYVYKNKENMGFFLFYKDEVINKANNYKIEEQVAYTVNSPNYARYWLPSNDRPRDKAKVSMTIIVPENFTAVSNGYLDEVLNIDNENEGEVGKKIFKWKDDVQIATYLVNATASVYKQYLGKFKSPNIKDSIELQYYVWESDYNGKDFKAERKLRKTPEMLEFFSKKFIDYPFCKYGQAVVYPFIYGAMENQTMTTLHRHLILQTAPSETTIAHEIAHQWFGDLVTAISWDDIWFKEGAATWSEALWTLEATQDTNKYYSYMQEEAVAYKKNEKIFTKPIYGNAPELIFTTDYVPLTYNKASWVYHQLRILLGEELLFNILKELLEEYKFKNVDASIIVNFFKEKTKDIELEVSLDKFFEQWLYKAGHPQYEINTNLIKKTDSTMDVHVTLTQIQSGENVSEVFETPAFICFYDGYKPIDMKRVLNNQKTQEFYFEDMPNITRVNIDLARTLCENKKLMVKSISEKECKLNVYPNPAMQSDLLYISNLEENIKKEDIQVFNILGNKLDVNITNLSNSAVLDISNLKDGAYYIFVAGKMLNFTVIR